MNSTIMKFELESIDHPMDVMSKFFPQGNTVLNRVEWRSKEPRSCGITNVKSRTRNLNSNEPTIFDIEVTYRPKGHITYTGGTKYDGWTAMMLNRSKDGTLLNSQGDPLPEGQSPIYLPFEVHTDIDFNQLNFGEFVGEAESGGIPHRSVEDVLNEFYQLPSLGYSISIDSTFQAHRRYRPSVKIILVDGPSGIKTDGFGTRVVAINNFTPQLQQVILNELSELVSGFVEGRYSMKNVSNDHAIFVELDDSFVDCTPNAIGKDSRFNCLHEYVPDDFLEDLAKRLAATYWVDITIVDGPKGGLLLKALKPSKR